MQTAEQLSALSSKDGQQWWGLTGCVGSLPLDTPHPDVRRLVMGDLSTDAAVEVSETQRSLLQNLQAAFPRLTHLHLWNVRQLRHLGGLPASLQCLDLRGCRELRQIDPLPNSARLQSLDLADCAQLTALPEADYSCLTRVWLHGCLSLLSFQPLLAAVPSLKHLELHDCRFQDLDASLCGVPGENVADKVRQHFQALQDQTEVPFAECKLIVLGDGGVGKTSLVRAILGEHHNPDEPITHGIGLWRWNGAPEGQQPPVLFPNQSDAQLTLNIWDFGGQDLYHNTHRLFMEAQAVFIVVERWKDPKKPRRPQNPTDIDRPLQYWLEQVAAATAGSQHQPRVLIVRTAIDDQTQEPFALAPWQERVKTEFHEHCYFELSCLDDQRDTEAWKTFRSTLLEQIRETLGGAKSKSILQPRGRVAVRQKLKASQPACNEPRTSDHTAAPMLLLHQFHDLVRQTFQEHGLPEPNKAELDGQLDFFHQRGVVYAPPSWLKRHSTPSAFPVIVDQLWLIEGIYQFISTQSLRDDWIVQCGKVTREDLDSAWDQLQTLKPGLRLDPQARWAMLACMENFGLLVSTQADEEWTGILPEFLPKRQTVLEGQAQRNDTVIGEWKVQQKRCYRLQDTALGMGIGCQLIGWLISTFGQTYRLYRFGALVTLQVYSSESAESRQVRVELRWEKESEDDFAGDLWLWLPADCGVEAEVLCYLEEQLQRRQLVRKGTQFARQLSRDPSARAQPTPYIHLEPQHLPKRGGRLPGHDTGTTVRPVYTLGRVGISWAGGAADSEQEFWPLLIDRMLRERSQGKFDVVQYKKTEHDPATTHDMIGDVAESDFMIAVISDKYLNSEYCMVELLKAGRKWSTARNEDHRSAEDFLGECKEWLPRIRFFILDDARYICSGDNTQPDTREITWSKEWYERGQTYCRNLMAIYKDSSTARKQGAEKNAHDAWMRFVNHGINQALIFANAIRNSQDRMALSPLAEPTRLTTARRLLEPHITQKLLPAIQRFIAGLLPTEKRARLIDFALRKYRVGDTATAWACVYDCLQQFQNPQEMSQQLEDDETVPQELSELKPLLPAWRQHIGVTRPPASP